MKPEIYAIVTAVNELTRQMFVDEERIEKLELALVDMSQYISRADWCYLKPETLAALEGKDD